MDGRQPPEQADITFEAVEGVYMALKTLRCCGDASSPEQRSALRGIHSLNPPKKLHPLSRVVVAHPFDATARCKRPHVGHWGAGPAGGGHGCGGCDASCVLC
jgi:hypothetical protein